MVMRATRKAERPDRFWPGIPNRDLTEDEYRALTNEQRRTVRDSGDWDVLTDAQYAEETQPKPPKPSTTETPPAQPERKED